MFKNIITEKMAFSVICLTHPEKYIWNIYLSDTSADKLSAVSKLKSLYTQFISQNAFQI